MSPDEPEIIRRALRGDDEAFESVIRFMGRKICAVAYGILQDASEAEDVAQETFLKAHRHRCLLRDPEKFPTWLFAVARNRSLDRLRRLRPLPLEDVGNLRGSNSCNPNTISKQPEPAPRDCIFPVCSEPDAFCSMRYSEADVFSPESHQTSHRLPQA